MFSRNRTLFASTVVGILVLSGCSSFVDSIPFAKESQKNSISGRDGVDGPVMVVKVDDTSPAHPQAGLEEADLIYIEQVEGGLTRLAAVFSSSIPERVGPVRSARISDIEILAQYGRVLFAYSGAQQKLLPAIDAANLLNYGAQRQPPSVYTTDPNRNSPVAMILRADLLMQKALANGEVAKAKSMGWSFGGAPDDGVEISKVKVSWPAHSYTANWSADEKRWHLLHGEDLNLAESGQVLGPTTFVIQLIKITPSEYGDKFGGVTPFSETIGSGQGYILRDGKYFKAQWSRPSLESGTQWTSPDGSEIKFAPGQIWVALTDKAPEFTNNSLDAPKSKSK